MNLWELSISRARALLDNREISSRELTRSVLDRIAAVDDKIGAYLTLADETAMEEARRADAAIKKGRVAPLTGIPLAIKDVICTRGLRTTCASRILENFIPPYDATVIEKLRQSSGVLLGKTEHG